MSEQRIAIVACTADDIDIARPMCVGCWTTFSTEAERDAHVRGCPAHRDHYVLKTLHAQAVEDGRAEDADELLLEILP